MAENERLPQRADSQAPSENRQLPRETTQPYDYRRHIEGEHHLLVDFQKGAPTAIKRFRLFRASQNGKGEKNLVVFTGDEPAAMDFFFRFLHPLPRMKMGGRLPDRRRV